jgi:Down syndrome cell adhesion molecule
VGDRTSVQCVVGTGDLPLVFTWLKDNVPIKQSRTVGVNDNIINGDPQRYDKRLNNKDDTDDEKEDIAIRQNDAFTSALSIKSIEQYHAGEYTCRVQNGAAIVQYSAILKVNGIKAINVCAICVFSCCVAFFSYSRSMLLILAESTCRAFKIKCR